MFPDSNRTVFIFRSWFDSLQVVLFYFHYKILKTTSKLLTQGYRYHMLPKTFGKFFILNFCLSLVQYRFKNTTHSVIDCDFVYKLRRVKDAANVISSGSKK